jgi:hypothetical protein
MGSHRGCGENAALAELKHRSFRHRTLIIVKATAAEV